VNGLYLRTLHNRAGRGSPIARKKPIKGFWNEFIKYPPLAILPPRGGLIERNGF